MINVINEMNRSYKIIVLILFMVLNNSSLAMPVLSKLVVSDVSDRSFSIIFTADVQGTPFLEVYSNSEATSPAVGYELEFLPVQTGDVTDFVSESKNIIRNLSKSLGINKVTVTGLSPNQQYFIKVGYKEDLTGDQTICPDSGVLNCLAITGIVAVKTNEKISRTVASAEDTVIKLGENFVYLNSDASKGELILLASENSKYPISVYMGDGVPVPYTRFDLNNLTKIDQSNTYFVKGQDVRENGNYGDAVIVRNYRGTAEDTSEVYTIGSSKGDGTNIEPNLAIMGDCNNDGKVNSYDILLMQYVISNNIMASDYSKFPFHILPCDLVKSNDVYSLDTGIMVDDEDYDQLSDLLVGKTESNNLPVSQ